MVPDFFYIIFILMILGKQNVQISINLMDGFEECRLKATTGVKELNNNKDDQSQLIILLL